MIIELYVLAIVLSQGAVNLATFTGPNAMADCAANGQRITVRELGPWKDRVYVNFRRAHCERIEVTP
tara:strand:+ start:376 stop:576 length:201 start_codon:yes stop_codon:yes gene_type:complete